MASTWTQENLADIEEAIAQGALEVEYSSPTGTRKVRYRSFKEMKEIRELIRRSLGITRRSSHKSINARKGIC